MSNGLNLWICWAAFAVATYVIAYLDYIYYKDDIKSKARQLYEAITEED